MLRNPVQLPLAADVMAYDRVEEIAAVSAFWSAGAHDLLDLFDRITAPLLSKPLLPFIHTDCRCGFAPLRPDGSAQSNIRSTFVSSQNSGSSV